MSKILAQAGTSLADTYDVVGSIAGIDNLESQDVNLVHEMGATIFSERFAGVVRRLVTAAVAQNTAFDVVLASPNPAPSRILGITVHADVGARTNDVALFARDPVLGDEILLWNWFTTEDTMQTIRTVVAGAAAANEQLFKAISGSPGNVPSMLTGGGQAQRVSEIVLRGNTNGFGAGTVTITALVYLAFATDPTGLSSRGLPIPSW